MHNPLNAFELILAPVTKSPEARLFAVAVLDLRDRIFLRHPRHIPPAVSPCRKPHELYRPGPPRRWRGNGAG